MKNGNPPDSEWKVINDVAKALEGQVRLARGEARDVRERVDEVGARVAAAASDSKAALIALAEMQARVEVLEAELQNRGILPPLWRAVVKVVRR